MSIEASTRVFALLGDPVGHSLSPRFQNAGFRAAGLDAVYVAIRCTAEELPSLMRTLASNGGGGNVTVPHKTLAASVAGVPSARVSTLGVANVFAGQGGELHLDNTDVAGILRSLDRIEAPSDAWLLAGTGGSARAVVGAAVKRGARLAIRSRSAERAEAFARFAAGLGVEPADPAECRVAINATPLGLKSGDPLPIDPRSFPGLRWAIDLVYRTSGTTLWIETCQAAGLKALDGRELLLTQGSAAWRLWFPGVFPPLQVMRAALLGRLG